MSKTSFKEQLIGNIITVVIKESIELLIKGVDYLISDKSEEQAKLQQEDNSSENSSIIGEICSFIGSLVVKFMGDLVEEMVSHDDEYIDILIENIPPETQNTISGMYEIAKTGHDLYQTISAEDGIIDITGGLSHGLSHN
jgi:hypothetical protein